MFGIFISYRRADASAYAGRIYDRLVADLGKDHVFVDIDSIRPGEDFSQRIDAVLSEGAALVAIIGPRWNDRLPDLDIRRLDDHKDFVRLEIETALKRDILVVPVLVGGATMPGLETVPETV